VGFACVFDRPLKDPSLGEVSVLTRADGYGVDLHYFVSEMTEKFIKADTQVHPYVHFLGSGFYWGPDMIDRCVTVDCSVSRYLFETRNSDSRLFSILNKYNVFGDLGCGSCPGFYECGFPTEEAVDTVVNSLEALFSEISARANARAIVMQEMEQDIDWHNWPGWNEHS